MALNEDWVQELLTYKVTLEARDGKNYGGPKFSDSGEIGRAWVDGVLVVYDLSDAPAWLGEVLEARDDDGNTSRAEPRVAVT
jgi:hypothetical protein